jgi:DNA-binding NarL/FixJ family response regulator
VRVVIAEDLALLRDGLERLLRDNGFDVVVDRLTSRELEVLGLMAESRSNVGIATALVISIGAVEKHVARIFGKLRLPPAEGDHRRVLAVLTYLQQQTAAL